MDIKHLRFPGMEDGEMNRQSKEDFSAVITLYNINYGFWVIMICFNDIKNKFIIPHDNLTIHIIYTYTHIYVHIYIARLPSQWEILTYSSSCPLLSSEDASKWP